MKNIKFEVKIYDENDTLKSEKKYASIKEINRDYPELDYSVLRNIHKYSLNNNIKVHEYTKTICKRMKIINYIPEL
jgi:hypothetical protein